MMTNPTTRPSSSTRTTSFDLRSEPSPRAMGPLPVWTGCSRFIGFGRSALRRAENIAAPRSRSAMHAIDGVRGAVTVVRRSTVSRSIAQFRWAVGDLGPSRHTGETVILIPAATAAVVLRPSARSVHDSGISSIARGSGGATQNRRVRRLTVMPRPRREEVPRAVLFWIWLLG